MPVISLFCSMLNDGGYPCTHVPLGLGLNEKQVYTTVRSARAYMKY